ncbi:TPA: restriction endonuclease subunit S [Vibrio parahaemolyticus]|uniref:restriction endonuclease subunit S n=1 Tax=Vibrio parahaemolyticus TaxID=670 RepID=UPI000EB754D2|nr:restriction endonuclease subunit S [Vibrio parahaemolyticus]AYF17690.1 Type I restriction-modification system, specificity subunit S [Vibrio parahaemolyticus]HCG5268013.1 restriction endonuclease subunit S [Vibrio parahaemolyticus]
MSELPKGWTKASFDLAGDYTDYVSNGSFASLKENVTQTDVEDFAILLRLKDFNNSFSGDFKYITESSYNYLSKSKLEPGDLFLSNVGAPGKTFIIPDLKMPMSLAPNGIRVRASSITSNKYLHYFISSPVGGELIDSITGGNAQQKFNKTALKKSELPLAPLNEQIRIVNKLDSILAKVDKAQARLDKIPAILKRFRQSVLAAATSGELTKEWRTLNVVPETELEQIESYWQNELLRQGRKYKPYRYPQGDIDKLGWLPSKLGAICDVHVGSTPKRTEKTYWGGDVKWVSSSEVAFCEIFDTKEKITTLGLDNSSTRLHPPGTVMLAMIGQGKTRGQPAILRAEACHNQNTAALRVPEPFLLSEYLYYFLWEKYEETRKIGGGNNQKALNKATVQSIDISLPSIREQRAIVKKIERLFKKANKVEKQYLEAKARLERLTQSILAKAFRGELVQQDPSDEPAEKLLERIWAEKEQRELKKTTRKRTKNAKTAEKE